VRAHSSHAGGSGEQGGGKAAVPQRHIGDSKCVRRDTA
jgi:hypothetical protein